jgi:NAD(P)H-dependent FMN reductase
MKALLLVGSPRDPSNSAALGERLLGLIAVKGWETESARVPPHPPFDRLLAAAAAADLVVMSFPLYVDSLPSHLTAFLEALAEQRGSVPPAMAQTLAAICQNGFPEAFHNLTALAICERFAAEAGFAWGGGLAMGMGEAIGRRPLAKAGGMLRHQLRALDLAAAALAEGKPIPPEAVGLMVRPLIPRWLYLWLGNRGWKSEAKKFGTRDRLRDRPYGE